MNDHKSKTPLFNIKVIPFKEDTIELKEFTVNNKIKSKSKEKEKNFTKSKTINKLTLNNNLSNNKIKRVGDEAINSLLKNQTITKDELSKKETKKEKQKNITPIKTKEVVHQCLTSPKKKQIEIEENIEKDKRVTFKANFIDYVDISIRKKSLHSEIAKEEKPKPSVIAKDTNNVNKLLYKSCCCTVF